MLKGIPSIISPELIKVLMEMGHGDELVIADGNFPAASVAKRLIRCDGHDVPKLLDAILRCMPLDQYVSKPVALMQLVSGDDVKTPIWDEYKKILSLYEPENSQIEMVERFDFYKRAGNAYAVIATSEKALYANIILKKGVIKE